MSKTGDVLKKYGLFLVLFAVTCCSPASWAGEADLRVPDLSAVPLFFNLNGRSALLLGFLVCIFGAFFGVVQYGRIKKMPVHKSMKDISELIYTTCKAYLVSQGKFLLMLEVIIGVVMVGYFGVLRHLEFGKVALILIAV
jgi:K(+)-stimulated pyrophosphate-energized sodium pump